MITQFFLDLINGVLGLFMGLIPDSLEAPGWLEGSASAVVGLFATAGSMGVWIPFDVAFAMAALLMNLYIGGGLVKGARIIISHLTGGGGSAA